MTREIDRELALKFTTALSLMIGTERMDPPVPNPRPMMFTYAPAGQEDQGIESLSRGMGMDIICLAFEPGLEHEGPTNVAVCEEREGQYSIWPRCSPWAFTKEGPCLLVADDKDVGFAYDNVAIVMTWNLPNDDIANRVEMGRGLLRLMIQRLPEYTSIERRLEKPIYILAEREDGEKPANDADRGLVSNR